MTLQELREELLQIVEDNGPEVLDYDIMVYDVLGPLCITVDHSNKEIILS